MTTPMYLLGLLLVLAIAATANGDYAEYLKSINKCNTTEEIENVKIEQWNECQFALTGLNPDDTEKLCVKWENKTLVTEITMCMAVKRHIWENGEVNITAAQMDLEAEGFDKDIEKKIEEGRHSCFMAHGNSNETFYCVLKIDFEVCFNLTREAMIREICANGTSHDAEEANALAAP